MSSHRTTCRLHDLSTAVVPGGLFFQLVMNCKFIRCRINWAVWNICHSLDVAMTTWLSRWKKTIEPHQHNGWGTVSPHLLKDAVAQGLTKQQCVVCIVYPLEGTYRNKVGLGTGNLAYFRSTSTWKYTSSQSMKVNQIAGLCSVFFTLSHVSFVCLLFCISFLLTIHQDTYHIFIHMHANT